MQLADYDSDFFRALNGHFLTTAEIIYHLPDYPSLLQSFIWQEFDLPPRFPKLNSFLDFWLQNIDAKIKTVRVATAGNLTANSFSLSQACFEIH